MSVNIPIVCICRYKKNQPDSVRLVSSGPVCRWRVRWYLRRRRSLSPFSASATRLIFGSAVCRVQRRRFFDCPVELSTLTLLLFAMDNLCRPPALPSIPRMTRDFEQEAAPPFRAGDLPGPDFYRRAFERDFRHRLAGSKPAGSLRSAL